MLSIEELQTLSSLLERFRAQEDKLIAKSIASASTMIGATRRYEYGEAQLEKVRATHSWVKARLNSLRHANVSTT